MGVAASLEQAEALLPSAPAWLGTCIAPQLNLLFLIFPPH